MAETDTAETTDAHEHRIVGRGDTNTDTRGIWRSAEGHIDEVCPEAKDST